MKQNERINFAYNTFNNKYDNRSKKYDVIEFAVWIEFGWGAEGSFIRIFNILNECLSMSSMFRFDLIVRLAPKQPT